MNALLYGIFLQFKMDIRSKTLLITCYIVPLLFFLIVGNIFSSIIPNSQETLIQSMTIMGISMGSLIGLPPSILEIYGTDIQKTYHAHHIPKYFGIVTLTVSTFIHLMFMSLIIFISAPYIFNAKIPDNISLYFLSLCFPIITSILLACILGLLCKDQAKLTMLSQILFLPSIMLSGIMFDASLLPSFLQIIGKILPATQGFHLLLQKNISYTNWFSLFIISILSLILISLLLRKKSHI